MATSLTSSVRINLNWTLTNTPSGGVSTDSSSGSVTFSDSLANGTGADQADIVYAATGTIAASGTLNLDLAGVLSSAFGATLTFVKVKCFYFTLTTDTTSSAVALGGAGTNPAALWFKDSSDKEQVRNGGCTLHWAPDSTAWGVTAGTGDRFLITNEDGTNTATYQLVILGTSA